MLASTYRDHIILCGLGHVGYRILERLLHWHLDVVVIEKTPSHRFWRAPSRWECRCF